jgi:hypothetical protein
VIDCRERVCRWTSRFHFSFHFKHSTAKLHNNIVMAALQLRRDRPFDLVGVSRDSRPSRLFWHSQHSLCGQYQCGATMATPTVTLACPWAESGFSAASLGLSNTLIAHNIVRTADFPNGTDCVIKRACLMPAGPPSHNSPCLHFFSIQVPTKAS